jgi:hypothetical protein
MPLICIGYAMPPIVGFVGPIENVPFGKFLTFLAVAVLWSLTR